MGSVEITEDVVQLLDLEGNGNSCHFLSTDCMLSTAQEAVQGLFHIILQHSYEVGVILIL